MTMYLPMLRSRKVTVRNAPAAVACVVIRAADWPTQS